MGEDAKTELDWERDGWQVFTGGRHSLPGLSCSIARNGQITLSKEAGDWLGEQVAFAYSRSGRRIAMLRATPGEPGAYKMNGRHRVVSCAGFFRYFELDPESIAGRYNLSPDAQGRLVAQLPGEGGELEVAGC
jgi:hypothetical protein